MRKKTCIYLISGLLLLYLYVYTLIGAGGCTESVANGAPPHYEEQDHNFPLSRFTASSTTLPDVELEGCNNSVLEQTIDHSQAHIQIIGTQRFNKSYLTIGIPSVKRSHDSDYLSQTLQSLVNETSPEEKMDLVVVVFLADWDTDYNERMARSIAQRFSEYLKTGFIQVMQVTNMKEFYPDTSNVKRNFNDSVNRVQWRTKQVLDYTVLWNYARNLSKLYMQLEDDVICAEKFVSKIKLGISRQRTNWVVLEFSELGFIGKLFRSDDLVKMIKFMVTFFDEMPVDWLFEHFRESMGQKKGIVKKPTLFQHVGRNSSYIYGKEQKLKDRYFKSKKGQRYESDSNLMGDNVRIFQDMNDTDAMKTLEKLLKMIYGHNVQANENVKLTNVRHMTTKNLTYAHHF